MWEPGHEHLRTRFRASSRPESRAAGRGLLSFVCFPAILFAFEAMICILGLCLRPGFSQQVESNTEQEVVLRGTVVNKLTHDPIGRALVYSPDNRLATLTDGEGHFEFRVPKLEPQRSANSGTSVSQQQNYAGHSLAARKPGFLNDPGSANVLVSPGVDTTIFLIPEAIILGRVLVSSPGPTPTINLELFKRDIYDGRPHWMGRWTARTNSNGEFRFPELEPGEYKIMTTEQLDNDPQLSSFGFPPSCFPGVPDFSSGTPIQLDAGQTFDASMTVVRQPYFRVKIPVAGDQAVASGMSISVLAEGHPGPGYSLGYNHSQHRIEGLLPNGTYLIQANIFAVPHQMSGMVSITVAGRELEGPILALAGTGPIPVQVSEQFSSSNQPENPMVDYGQGSFRIHGPRTYLNLYLEPVEDFPQNGRPALGPPRSPGDENLEIVNALPGRYWVHANSSRGYPATITAGDVDLRQEPLVVLPGATSAIEITMRDDFAMIEGTLSGGNLSATAQQPTENRSRASVYCLPLPGSPGQFQQLWPSPDGKFTFSAMVPGAYRILALEGAHPELAYRNSEAMRAYDSLGQVVNLVAGQTAHLELQPISGPGGE